MTDSGRVPSEPGSHPSGHASYAVDGASRFDPSRILSGIAGAVGEVRSDMLDYPTAWRIQHSVGTLLLHHPECSSRPQWAMLCDCGAVETCWRQLCALQTDRTS